MPCFIKPDMHHACLCIMTCLCDVCLPWLFASFRFASLVSFGFVPELWGFVRLRPFVFFMDSFFFLAGSQARWPDEDINTIVTPTAPAAIHTGPITRARACQLNYQVLSFLGNPVTLRLWGSIRLRLFVFFMDSFFFLVGFQARWLLSLLC